MGKLPHFFKVKSRIGLTHPPIRHSEFNFGVEDGGDFVLTDDLLKNFPGALIHDFAFQEPEKIDKNIYWKEIAKDLQSLKKLINEEINQSETQVVLGGDNTVTLSSLEAAIERFNDPSKIGYIQFDSHGEMHQSKTSISKNFHGMYMRPFFDQFDEKDIDDLVPKKMKTSQILTIGDIIFDGKNTEEEQFYIKNKIRNICREEYLKDEKNILEEIEKFIVRFDHLHINFDVDVFHESVSSATGLPEDGRWFREEVFNILDLIAKKQSLSIDIVEINPRKEDAKKTIRIAQEILIKLLSY